MTVALIGALIPEVIGTDTVDAADAIPATMLDPRALDVIIVRGKIEIDDEMVEFPIDLSIAVTVNLGPIGVVTPKEGDEVKNP